MEFKLNKDQRNIVNGAAKEQSRPVLACIHIKPGIAEVADGFTLIQKYIEYDGPELLLNAKEVSTIKDMKAINGAMFTDSTDNGHVTVLGEATTILNKADGTFPATDRLYPESLPVFKIAISKDLLLNVIKSMNKDSKTIRFYFHSESSPIAFQVGEDMQGLIMPMFVKFDGDNGPKPYVKPEPVAEVEPIAESLETVTENSIDPANDTITELVAENTNSIEPVNNTEIVEVYEIIDKPEPVAV